jgi:glycosyltransferase involved in cell wall biosynthesis
MKLAFVADGRSPIARSWIEHFLRAGDRVHLISTRSCAAMDGLASLEIVPLWPRAAGAGGGERSQRNLAVLTAMRHWFGPWFVARRASMLRGILSEVGPDVVHAMRLPFEGMLAAAARPAAPLVISTWGNDLTLHAPATPLMRWATWRSLRRAGGLHADCERDARLAQRWGLRAGLPSIVMPGNGGVRRNVFYPGPSDQGPDFGLPAGAPVVVQPRGLRAYVRSDAFFKAVPRVLSMLPNTVFVCPAMEGAAEAEAWCARLGVGRAIRLLPSLDPPSMAALFRRADVSLSPSVHDGTPNTLLEAMACGCLPVAGDLESIREWIQDEENGLLIDPTSEHSVAEGVVRGLTDAGLRGRASRINVGLIADRADYDRQMPRAASFYEQVLRG